MSRNTFQREISADIDEEFFQNEKKQKKFENMSCRVTCNGCIWSDLVNFINGDKKSVFNLKIGIHALNGSDVYLFDKIKKDDDKEFIYAVANVMDVLQRIALMSKTDILTALQNEKLKKIVFAQNDFIFSYIKRWCYYADYPGYVGEGIRSSEKVIGEETYIQTNGSWRYRDDYANEEMQNKRG